MSELRERSTRLRAEVEQLRKTVKEKRRQLLDTTLADYAKGQKEVPVGSPGRELLKCCRHLQGHTGKVYSLSWARKDVNKVVSASQDGRLIIWNALSSQKTHAVKLACQWVMACAFSPGGVEVACGGLDNLISIYRLSTAPDSEGNVPIDRTLSGHKGYISCCKYIPSDDAKLLTSSGDQTCALWDTRASRRISSFGGNTNSENAHSSDVMSVAVNPARTDEFVSGSCDATAKLWDVRTPARCVATLHGHTQDINAVQFLRNGYTVGSGSDDGTCRLFDIRTGHELQTFDICNVNGLQPATGSLRHLGGPATVTSVELSQSGRLLFAGYSDTRCLVWDTLLNQVVGQLGGHTERISCLGMATDGSAICSGSWDKSLRVFTVPQM